MTTSVATLATRLLELHHTGSTLVLPNVWDAWSAKVVAEAGFGALSIGSHPLADSRGQGDNEDMTLDDALDGVRRICSAVPEVPVTADMEAGYGATPQELVERLLEAGAVGLNIEDTVHSEGGRMRSAAEHADYIGAIRQAADAAGVDLVVNARTDVFLKKDQFDDPRRRGRHPPAGVRGGRRPLRLPRRRTGRGCAAGAPRRAVRAGQRHRQPANGSRRRVAGGPAGDGRPPVTFGPQADAGARTRPRRPGHALALTPQATTRTGTASTVSLDPRAGLEAQGLELASWAMTSVPSSSVQVTRDSGPRNITVVTVAWPPSSATTETASGRTSAKPSPGAEPSRAGTSRPSTEATPPATVAGSRLLSPTNSPTNRVAGAE